jgi:hypothetical protein
MMCNAGRAYQEGSGGASSAYVMRVVMRFELELVSRQMMHFNRQKKRTMDPGKSGEKDTLH